MYKHADKHCPYCNNMFECKTETVMQCQCSAIQLSLKERAYIESKYDDCLCIHCLLVLQKEYALFNEKQV
jgi:hypothetical protein